MILNFVISLNVDTIVHIDRKTMLSDFIKNNPADFFLLKETKLDASVKLYFPEFNIIRVRPGYGGTLTVKKRPISDHSRTFAYFTWFIATLIHTHPVCVFTSFALRCVFSFSLPSYK